MTDSVAVRLRVLAPSHNTVYAPQKGKADQAVRKSSVNTDGSYLVFELRMTVNQGKTNFGGLFAQYSLNDQFFCLSVSIQGQGKDSSSKGRIKLPVYMMP